MSAYEEDSARIADDLAELVNEGKITDAEAVAYLAGTANKKLCEKIERLARENDE